MVFISRFARTKRWSRTERRTGRNGFTWQGWYARRKRCKRSQGRKGGCTQWWDIRRYGKVLLGVLLQQCTWQKKICFASEAWMWSARAGPTCINMIIYTGKDEYCYAQEIVLFARQVFTKTFLLGLWVEVHVNCTLSRMLSYSWLPPALYFSVVLFFY